jgi:predicted ATP-dependent serine protease
MAKYRCSVCGETAFKGYDHCPACGAIDSLENTSKYRNSDEDPYRFIYADDDADRKTDYDFPYP